MSFREYVYSLLLSLYWRMDLLGHKVVQMYTQTSSIWPLLAPHFFSSTHFFSSIHLHSSFTLIYVLTLSFSLPSFFPIQKIKMKPINNIQVLYREFNSSYCRAAKYLRIFFLIKGKISMPNNLKINWPFIKF